jgi:IS5 family transposase
MSGIDQTRLDFDPPHKRTRKEVFLDEMNQVVPWGELVARSAACARRTRHWVGARRFRSHCLQLWWNLSDPAMEEELHERPLYRRFTGLEGAVRMPDETTILRFRHLPEMHELTSKILAVINAGLARQGLMLKTRAIVDASIIAAPSSTKNKGGERDPEMHQSKKGNQWHFGMKAHLGVDVDPAWCTRW